MAVATMQTTRIAGSLARRSAASPWLRICATRQFTELRQALLEHLVVFFRDQTLTPEQQIAFARRFGPLEEHDFVKGMQDYPEIIRVVKEADETTLNFGGAWHSDVTHQQCPALGSVLYAIDVPPYGGDTLFSNQYLAYETLSSGLKRCSTA